MRIRLSPLALAVSLGLSSISAVSFAEDDGVYTGFVYWNDNFGDRYTINGADKSGYQGSAIYKNKDNGTPGDISTGMIFGDNLTATTNGFLRSGQDVVMTKAGDNIQGSIVIGHYATLTAKTSSSDGINVGYSNGSIQVIVGDHLTINAAGMGVRANLGQSDSVNNTIVIGDNAQITTTGYGANDSDGNGYGVYAGNRERTTTATDAENSLQKGSAKVTIGRDSTITTSGTSSHAVFANKGGQVILGDNATIRTNNKSTSATAIANGINAEAGKQVNTEGGKISLLGGVNVSTAKATAWAISSTGLGSEVRSWNPDASTDTAGLFAIEGNIRADNQGVIALNMIDDLRDVDGETTLQSSAFNGNAMATNQGVITLSLRDQTQMTGEANAASSGIVHLALTDAAMLDGSVSASDSGTVNLALASSSRFTGTADTSTSTGIVNTTLSDDAIWSMTGDSVVTTLALNDRSTLRFSAPDDGAPLTPKTLIVEGNYTGNGGTLVLNTVLEGDESLTDKLIVKGDTAGNTHVGINNIGGMGDLTLNGIEIVQVEGNSNGIFTKAGRIVAGGYDYDVVKNASNWYLTSQLSPVDPDPEPDPEPGDPDPVDPPTPPGPVDPVDPPAPPGPVDPVDPPAPPGPVEPVEPPVPPTPPAPEPGEHQYRPEFGSYLANNYAANTLFITRLHDRLGETQYTDMLTGERKVTSLWLRNEGGHTRFTDGSNQLKTKANRYVMQIGGDLAQWSSDGLDRWHLGVMAGYANQKSKTHNTYTGYASRGHVNGYSAGLYATWYANEADKTGTYLDSWVLYNWFDNTVSGDHLSSEKYKSDGVTASVEGGYSFLVGESERASYWIQPKAQAIWMDVQADSHRESNGTQVKDTTDGNLMTRLGVRAYLKGHNAIDDDKNREFQPFVEANWIHNTHNQSVRMGAIQDEISGTKNIGELKVGVEGQINPRLQVWGNVAQQVGDNSYSDTAAMLGVKYSF